MASVLLVDDDHPILHMLKSIFESHHFSVSMASSAAEAVRVLDASFFDLVVTDIRMENPTAGYDVIRAAKRQPKPPVVVILSAFPIPAPEWRAAGADAMFMKGGGITRMLDDVQRMVRTSG